MTLNGHFALNFVLRQYKALKHGFRFVATLKLVVNHVNVVGELSSEKNSRSIARFPCDSTAFLFISLYVYFPFWLSSIRSAQPAFCTVVLYRIEYRQLTIHSSEQANIRGIET